jgi:hypothetical protein
MPSPQVGAFFHGHAALKAGVSGVFRAIGHGSAA